MLICDKRRPRTRGDTNIRPPQGGRIKTAPPASGPRLGRSLAGGLHPQDPQGCAPWCAFAHRAPAASVTQPEGGSGHGCDGGGGGQPLAVVHARRLAPGGFRASGKFKKVGQCEALRGDWGACPPCRATVGNPAQAVGGQGAAAGCARRPRTGRGCPRAPGPQGRAPAPPGSRPPQALQTPLARIKKGNRANPHGC